MGGGGGPGTDSNPWNPNNYTISVSSVGQETVSSWDNGPNGPVNPVATYPWSSMLQSLGAHNATGTTRTGYMLSEGIVTLTISWIGVGPGPDRVLCRIISNANGGVTPASGTIDLNNAIGSPIETQYDTVFAVWKNQFGPKDRYIPLSNKQGTLELTKSARATVTTGNDMRAWASARGASMSVAERAVTVSGSPSPTYHYGYHDMPFPNSTDDPKNLTMDIGVYYESGYGGPPWRVC